MKTNDEISLSKPENKAFTFVDKSTNNESKWPLQLREKYSMCRELGKQVFFFKSIYCFQNDLQKFLFFSKRGAYGEVLLAFSNQTMEKFAIKIISKKKFTIRGKNEQVKNYSLFETQRFFKDIFFGMFRILQIA